MAHVMCAALATRARVGSNNKRVTRCSRTGIPGRPSGGGGDISVVSGSSQGAATARPSAACNETCNETWELEGCRGFGV